jgi:hypothetical protein
MIRTKELDIEGQKYNIKPLTGKYLGKFFGVLKAVSKLKENSKPEEILDALDENTVTNLHLLTMESMKRSGIKMEEEELDMYVAQNLFTLMGPVLEVNMPKGQ